MPTPDRPDDAAGQSAPRTPGPRQDSLETALSAAAEAGVQQEGSEIAADDAGGSKLATEIDRERKLPDFHPPGEDEA